MVMQTTHFRQLPDRPQFGWLNRPRVGGIHVKGPVNSPAMIIVHIRLEQAPQMPLVQHNHFIQALSANAANDPFAVGILSRIPWGNEHFFDAHVADALLKMVTVDGVSIS
jgi:hypothetical protein